MAAFSWSKTRDSIFRRCLRNYYYHYYASREAANPPADPFTRELFIMRHLKTLSWPKKHIRLTINHSGQIIPLGDRPESDWMRIFGQDTSY